MKPSLPTREVVGYRIKAAVCRCRFCPDCCRFLGARLRDALVGELGQFAGGVMGLTLTVDPENFGGNPEAAFLYVRDSRCVPLLVKKLHAAGYLASRRYFVVVEWQANGFPHWHLLVESSFVPFAALTEIWDKFRPKWLPPPTGSRPPMGCCRFSANKFTGGLHAARYIAKYLTKHPGDGYPEWVTNASYRIRRYSTSKGFWTAGPAPLSAEEEEILSQAARDDDDDTGADCTESRTPPEKEPRTIRDRVSACKTRCNVFTVTRTLDPFTGEFHEEENWTASTCCDLDQSSRELYLCPDARLENHYCIFVPAASPGWSTFLLNTAACGEAERSRYDRDYLAATLESRGERDER